MVIDDLTDLEEGIMEKDIRSIDEVLVKKGLTKPYSFGGPNIIFDYNESGMVNLVYKLNRSLNRKFGVQVEYTDKRVFLVPVDGPSRGILSAYKERYVHKTGSKNSV